MVLPLCKSIDIAIYGRNQNCVAQIGSSYTFLETEGLISRITVLVKPSTLPSEENIHLMFWKIGIFKYIVV